MSKDRRGMLPRAEIASLAESIRLVLGDGNADLSPARRARLEGALTALEVALGQPSSLLNADHAADIRSLL